MTLATFKEAIELCRTMSAQDPLQYNATMAKLLHNYAHMLSNLNQVSEAVEWEKEALSLFYDLVKTGEESPKNLCISLNGYGWRCHVLGRHTEAVLAYQESIDLRRAWVETDPRQRVYLMTALHNIANSVHALGENAEADAAANEALQMNDPELFIICRYAPNRSSCFVCRKAITPAPPPF